MSLAFMTHRGTVRGENQDALCLAGEIRSGDMASPETKKTGSYPLLFAVIDGMGGCEGGAHAARILVEALAEGVNGKIFGADLDPEADELALRNLLQAAALHMKAAALEVPDLAQMGATVAGILLRERSAVVFNCGDCRVYRFSGAEAERLTHEHSLVQEMFDRGEIDEDGMRTHPGKNIVTSAISPDAAIGFEFYTRPLSRCEGDSYFICSDGVWEAMNSRTLSQWLARPFPDAASGLFAALIESGCRDNVSFIWIDAE